MDGKAVYQFRLLFALALLIGGFGQLLLILPWLNNSTLKVIVTCIFEFPFFFYWLFNSTNVPLFSPSIASRLALIAIWSYPVSSIVVEGVLSVAVPPSGMPLHGRLLGRVFMYLGWLGLPLLFAIRRAAIGNIKMKENNSGQDVIPPGDDTKSAR